jgi:hypothetical protein
LQDSNNVCIFAPAIVGFVKILNTLLVKSSLVFVLVESGKFAALKCLYKMAPANLKNEKPQIVNY